MGIAHLEDFERFRVIVWAYAVLTRSGGRSTSVRRLFSKGSGSEPSTLFHRCLSEGRPWPSFEASESRRGSALQIEAKYPGTLIWLIHPIWDAIGLFFSYTLEQTFRDLMAMRPSVREIVFLRGDGDREWREQMPQVVEELHEEGSLDALLALMLISRQAYCLADLEAYIVITSRVVLCLRTMKCLQWMPRSMRELFVSVVSRTISSQQPSLTSEANACEFRRARLRLNILNYTGMAPVDLDEDVDVAFECSGEIHGFREEVSLHPKAREVFERLSAVYDPISSARDGDRS